MSGRKIELRTETQVVACHFTTDGNWLVTIEDSGQIRGWNVRSGKCVSKGKLEGVGGQLSNHIYNLDVLHYNNRVVVLRTNGGIMVLTPKHSIGVYKSTFVNIPNIADIKSVAFS